MTKLPGPQIRFKNVKLMAIKVKLKQSHMHGQDDAKLVGERESCDRMVYRVVGSVGG